MEMSWTILQPPRFYLHFHYEIILRGNAEKVASCFTIARKLIIQQQLNNV